MKGSAPVLAAILALGLVACSGRAERTRAGSSAAPAASGIPKVEIAYLNHGPVITALSDVNKLLASYGDRISVTRYDLETDQGEAFARSKGLSGHFPIAIFVNGASEIKLKDHTVKFFSFPKGTGTFMIASGSWTADDLRQAIDQALSGAK
jgi:hypothetical protein